VCSLHLRVVALSVSKPPSARHIATIASELGAMVRCVWLARHSDVRRCTAGQHRRCEWAGPDSGHTVRSRLRTPTRTGSDTREHASQHDDVGQLAVAPSSEAGRGDRASSLVLRPQRRHTTDEVLCQGHASMDDHSQGPNVPHVLERRGGQELVRLAQEPPLMVNFPTAPPAAGVWSPWRSGRAKHGERGGRPG
jgi:hypothetical protein